MGTQDISILSHLLELSGEVKNLSTPVP